MACQDQLITDHYALYNGDCVEVMAALPNDSIHLSVYSPPFGGLYNYSSSDQDLSNTVDYYQFFDHYDYVIEQIARVTMPGRMTAVHCADIPSGNTGNDYMIDFTGDVIRHHEAAGWKYVARYSIWKEPLWVRNRTMVKNLAHKTIVDDATKCSNAAADYVVVFRNAGQNKVPVANPTGLLSYAGSKKMPSDRLQNKGYEGNQIYNTYSHWIWRQYASCFWDDIRMGRVLPFREARDPDDEKHVHPLQLDVIERIVQLWSNAGETVLTPFMGVGSEVYGAVKANRKGLGVELKASYYRQAVKNAALAFEDRDFDQHEMDFGDVESE